MSTHNLTENSLESACRLIAASVQGPLRLHPTVVLIRKRDHLRGRSQSHSKKIWREMAKRAPAHEYDFYTSHCKHCGVPEFAVVDGIVTEVCSARAAKR